MAASLEAGKLVAERFSLERQIGTGGMSWVWEAMELSTERRVALKFLKGNKEGDRKRFQREARAATALEHPNVATVHDILELEDESLVMVLELLEGETLGGRLEREGPLALASLCTILLSVTSALAAAHGTGIIHRDLKPENIFLSKDGVVKVLDFGVAKLTSAQGLAAQTQSLTSTGSLIGTPYYMAPEQVLAEKDIDGRADIWSLGIVLYECLTGRRPTEAENVGRVFKRIIVGDFEPLRAVQPQLPADVLSLVDSMLSVDREKRPARLEDVNTILEKHTSDPALAETIADSPRVAAVSEVRAADTDGGMVMSGERSKVRRRAPLIAAAVLACGVGLWQLEARRSAPSVASSVPPPVSTPAPTFEPISSASVATPTTTASASAEVVPMAAPAIKPRRVPIVATAASSIPVVASSPPPVISVEPPAASRKVPGNFARTPKD